MIRRLAGCVVLAAATSAAAQELTGHAGVMRGGEPEAHALTWAFSYAQDFGAYFAASFSYRNEGHIPNHHRDGQAVQAWVKTPLGGSPVTLAAGIGPYRYYDTTVPDGAVEHTDEHGTAVLYSIAATWRTSGRWLYELRYNLMDAKHSFDARELLIGVGYRLDRDDSSRYAAPPPGGLAARDELTVYGGVTIVNSFESQTGFASSVEYRHAFSPLVKGSLAWLAEGEAQLTRRNGVLLQGWLEPSFSHGAFTLGVGAGVYIATDSYREDDGGAFGSGVVTMSASCRFGRDWTGRFSFHRILSSYNRDSDILLLGLGYRL